MLSLRLALRYTLGHRRGRLASFISWMAIAGLALGVALLITVTSVMNGFDRELRDRILVLVPHLYLFDNREETSSNGWSDLSDRVLEHPQVRNVTPVRQVYAMLRFRGEAQPILLNGVDPQSELDAGELGSIIGEQTFEQMSVENNQLYLGAGIAKNLGVKTGDTVVYFVPQSDSRSSINGSARVAGIIATGTELDNRIGLYSFEDEAFPDSMHGPSGLRIYLDDLFGAYATAYEIMRGVPASYSAVTWESSHGNLYEAIQLSRQMVGLIVFLVLAIAAFNVVASLLIVSADKQGEMAILKTMGASGSLLSATFSIQGLLIGMIGTVLGLAVGLLLSFNVTGIALLLERVLGLQLLDLAIYPIDYVPSDPQIGQIVGIVVVSLLLSLFAALYPAIRAARLKPATVLRYE